MNKLVIIPAAIAITPEMQFDFGEINPCMLPIGSMSVIEKIISSYDENTKFEIIAYSCRTFARFFKNKDFKNTKLTIVDDSKSISDTILKSKYISDFDNVVINFADTVILDTNTPNEDFIITQESEDLLRWTRMSIENNKISEFFDKTEVSPQEKKCISGVFGLSDSKRFLETLRDDSSFFDSIKQYYNSSKYFKTINATIWEDYGHVDNYYRLKRNSFRERSFNSLTNTNNNSIVRKSSQDEVKFKNEINWYLKLPDELSYIHPRIFNSSLENDIYIDSEFCSFPSLDNLLIYGNLDKYVWKNIFKSIGNTLSSFYKFQKDDSDIISESLQNVYIDKTITRLNQAVTQNPRFKDLYDGEITINNSKCLNISQIIELLPNISQKFDLLSQKNFTLIHGDLCCSNVLFDRKTHALKLIDPRGSFGSYDIYGDPLYDLAKMSHSFLGGYDFILSGFFEFQKNGNDYIVNIQKSENFDTIGKLFKSFLTKMGHNSVDKIRLIESLLFLSMTPLHQDNPEAQIIFALQGIKIFSDIYFNHNNQILD